MFAGLYCTFSALRVAYIVVVCRLVYMHRISVFVPVPPVHMILLNYKIDGLTYTYVRRTYVSTYVHCYDVHLKAIHTHTHTRKKTTSAAVKVEVTAIIRTELVKRF